jgi:hypothetical protein
MWRQLFPRPLQHSEALSLHVNRFGGGIRKRSVIPNHTGLSVLCGTPPQLICREVSRGSVEVRREEANGFGSVPREDMLERLRRQLSGVIPVIGSGSEKLHKLAVILVKQFGEVLRTGLAI